MHALYELASQRAEVARLLADAERDGEEEGWVDALVETLDALEGELAEVADARLRAALSFESAVEAIAAEQRILAERKRRLAAGAATLRAQIRDAMESAGKKRLPLALRTLSIGQGRESVVITDESLLPRQMIRTKTEPNVALIGETLRAGETVPGAALERGPSTLRVTK